MGDRRPLGSRFQDCCRQTREGGGLPEGSIIPAGITHDLVLLIDLPARRMEREERLLAMHGGDVNTTLWDISREGGENDARFLLAHGADADYVGGEDWSVLSHAASRGHLAVVEALLDAGAGELELALSEAACACGHTVRPSSRCCSTAGRMYTLRTTMRCTGRLFAGIKRRSRSFSTGAQLCGRRTYILEASERQGHHAFTDLLRAHLQANL